MNSDLSSLSLRARRIVPAFKLSSIRDTLTNQFAVASNTPTPSVPLVQFARFKNGSLEFFKAHVEKLEYIAISHVWGQVEWLHVACVDDEIYASQSKARFIGSQLPALVDDTAFWMDTLTVNQKNRDEVLAIVQLIPSIFRHAMKTIAVREGDGLYECCAKAIDGSDSWKDIAEKIGYHVADQHFRHHYEESFLKRLWTLQECLLSHTIQFVVCNTDGFRKEDPLEEHPDHHSHFYKGSRALDPLYVLASSFKEPGRPSSMPRVEAFIRAYLNRTTITRDMPPPYDVSANLFCDEFTLLHSSSNRSASKSRDYIFATMPQFPWYQYPKAAEHMSFTEIFLDLYNQALKSGHAFAARFTRSMTEDLPRNNTATLWLPSLQQPEPTCLGDFVKLLGKPLEAAHITDDYHVTTAVKMTSAAKFGAQEAFDLVERVMRFLPRPWTESYNGGELSRYGTSVETNQWINELCHNVHMYTKWNTKVPGTPTERGRSAARCRDVLFEELQKRHSDGWLVPQATKVLSLMWCSLDIMSRNVPMQNDWIGVRVGIDEHRVDWPDRLQHIFLLLAAMLSCQIPLSAILWVEKRFTPACIHYSDIKVLGLLALHSTASQALESGDALPMLSVGRHPAGENVAMDLVLADGVTLKPVGLLPDFLHADRSGEMYMSRMTELYKGVAAHITPTGAVLKRVPLSSVTKFGASP